MFLDQKNQGFSCATLLDEFNVFWDTQKYANKIDCF